MDEAGATKKAVAEFQIRNADQFRLRARPGYGRQRSVKVGARPACTQSELLAFGKRVIALSIGPESTRRILGWLPHLQPPGNSRKGSSLISVARRPRAAPLTQSDAIHF